MATYTLPDGQTIELNAPEQLTVRINARVSKFWCAVIFTQVALTIGMMPTPAWLKRKAVTIEVV